MSQSFVPGRIVGDSVVAEAEPFSYPHDYRGIDLGGPEPRRVVVRQPYASDRYLVDLFQTTVAETALLCGPAPRILHSLGRDGRVLALVLEHLEGVTLDHLLSTSAQRGERLAVPVALAIAQALVPLWARAPSLQIYVGPGTVVLSADGSVRARPELESEHARQTVGAMAHITIDPGLLYGSPEQMRGDRTIEQSGMFSLGVLLYEMLTGDHPVGHGGEMFRAISEVAMNQLPSVGTRRDDLPDHVVSLVDCALEHDPANRFASWEELRACLAAARSTAPPLGPAQLLESLPLDLRPAPPPPVDVAALGDWQRLPRDDLGSVPVPALPETAPTPTRPGAFVDPRFLYPRADQRPMLPHANLLVDARPVTAAEYSRFSMSEHQGGDEPATMVTHAQAEAYARWAGKRLPTDAEWSALVGALGAGTLDVGRVWEWTSTSMQDGHVVRGGRWRDAWAKPPSPGNRSYDNDRAADIGFRCVTDR